MRTRWIGLAMCLLYGVGIPVVHGGSLDSGQTDALSLESVARTYTTPKALARFLRHEMTLMTDEELFGTSDYWQTPEEFLTRRAGDCEDYALFVQAVLELQGVEAYVFSVFGPDGYAHTVAVFVESGRYHVVNQDRVRSTRASTLEMVAWQLSSRWTNAAITKRVGTRGVPVRHIKNPHPLPTFSVADSLLSFP